MRTITLNYDEVTGNVTDATGISIGHYVGAQSVKDDKSAQSIDDLINLKTAGFTVDDIVELKRKDLI